MATTFSSPFFDRWAAFINTELKKHANVNNRGWEILYDLGSGQQAIASPDDGADEWLTGEKLFSLTLKQPDWPTQHYAEFLPLAYVAAGVAGPGKEAGLARVLPLRFHLIKQGCCSACRRLTANRRADFPERQHQGRD